MESIKRYYLHKDDFAKLHFDFNGIKPYLLKNLTRATEPHRHGFFQIIWFLTAGHHYVDYEIIAHKKNSLFHINTNQIHYFCPDSKNEGYLFHFNDYFIDQFSQSLTQRFSFSIFNEIGKPYIHLSDKEALRFETIVNLISEELALGDYLIREQVFSLFSNMLFTIERLKNNENTGGINLSNDFKLAYRFKKAIYDSKDTFLNLEEYSKILNTNVKKLTAVAKEFLGDTPANIIQSVKILEAKRRLANKQVSIQEIAYELGFDQPTYFTKYFKKAAGITPKEFQSQLP